MQFLFRKTCLLFLFLLFAIIYVCTFSLYLSIYLRSCVLCNVYVPVYVCVKVYQDRLAIHCCMLGVHSFSDPWVRVAHTHMQRCADTFAVFIYSSFLLLLLNTHTNLNNLMLKSFEPDIISIIRMSSRESLTKCLSRMQTIIAVITLWFIVLLLCGFSSNYSPSLAASQGQRYQSTLLFNPQLKEEDMDLCRSKNISVKGSTTDEA